MKPKFSKQFLKAYRKSPKKVQFKVDSIMVVFLINPQSAELRNHQLSGFYQGCRSIDITGDWRAVYREVVFDGERRAYFVALGTHSQLYG